MKKSNNENVEYLSENVDSDVYQHEDAVLKTSMQFFAEELLPYLGIEGEVVSFAPTELVHLELKKLFQDFNFVMSDGSWLHFEFQSENEGLKGLKRFRVYESMASYQHNVRVTTYVLYSGKIKNPMTEFTEGLNTYRIHPIIMRKKNADRMISNLRKKDERGEKLTKEDLVPLILCPLMGGDMPQKDRLIAAYQLTQKAMNVENDDIRKIEAGIYAMADKFLEDAELEELKEEIKMTRLGQMLVNDGISRGKIESILELLEDLGKIPEELQKKIVDEKDLQILTDWLKLAAKANSIEEFQLNMK